MKYKQETYEVTPLTSASSYRFLQERAAEENILGG
jgi:hypothetical protein